MTILLQQELYLTRMFQAEARIFSCTPGLMNWNLQFTTKNKEWFSINNQLSGISHFFKVWYLFLFLYSLNLLLA